MTTLHVAMVPPSANVLRRRYRSPHAYKRLRQMWETALAYSVGGAEERAALRKQAEACRVRVRITLIHRGTYDDDNLYGALKPLLDALKNVGYIHDDSRKWCELEAAQREPAIHDALHLGATVLEIEACHEQREYARTREVRHGETV